MVWGRICASGKTPLVFVDADTKINPLGHSRSCCTSVGQKAFQQCKLDVSTRLRTSSQGQKDTRVVQGAFSRHDVICRMATLLVRSQSHGLQCMVHFGV
ncbi:hypothetical protein AVEN_118808-1 [Araneus ventricosus]|uniref:Uncharacterized protein n=1 Tax=Araneus ventricosus TaxID=182803 RepID=A0A4Y2BVJ7_ARAVE|nr:hypothetical protein AVEN_118808-1 [Araneus ventricosus]